MTDKRREPRPCRGVRGNNPTLYKLGNTLAKKKTRSTHPLMVMFKQARIAAGMSLVDVGEKSGHHWQSISEWETGQHAVKLQSLTEICAVVGLVVTVQSARAA